VRIRVVSSAPRRGSTAAARGWTIVNDREILRAQTMSQQNIDTVRKGIEAWNRRDAELWLSYAAPQIEWRPAGPAAVERSVYRGYDEVAAGFESTWQTWEEFRLEESDVRDLDDSALWLGRAKMRGGTSHIELDEEFAIHFLLHDGKVVRMRAFPTWRDALEAVGLADA
jgi:ketosteroid isomerase-like protein